MRPTSSLAVGVAVWLLVVAVGSTLVWVVISRAGDGVVSSQPPAPATGQPTPDASARSPRSESNPSTSSPSPSPSSSTPPAAGPARRTWQGVGGQVTVECRGPAASLVNAIPDSGFGFEIDDRGPDRVRVELERASDGDRSRIEARCVDGIPVFEAEVDVD
ncbi:hypothetical protein [Nocardioides astragali]|uniref:Septum formation initiator n=1 Tax=Nocardioides astragali TaxID=1776736 RepID=A0ABW2N456_9ACTN|nr:hypothetical protein [Nocardioides astragali]